MGIQLKRKNVNRGYMKLEVLRREIGLYYFAEGVFKWTIFFEAKFLGASLV